MGGPAATLDTRRLRAVIVDVDGTLYRQGPVRRAMLWRLLRAHLGAPRDGIVTLRTLQAYRRAQETLRREAEDPPDLAAAQLGLACRAVGVHEASAAACVVRWMEDEPLALVARSRREGVADFLRVAKARGLRLGVFSDYPPARKLAALGLAGLFDATMCAQDPDVRRFKPHPRGLQVTARSLGVDPSQALYVGDRPETDAIAARGAGMACAIVGGRRARPGEGWLAVTGYPGLTEALFTA